MDGKKGFLKKRGGFFGSFNKYWVTVQNRVLSVFSMPTDRVPTFEIALEGSSVVIADHLIGKRASLALFPSPAAAQKNAYPGAPLYFLADSEREREDWIRVMSASGISGKAPEHSVDLAVAALLDCAVVSDGKGDIVAFNRAAEHMFGWYASEIIGQNVTVLMPQSVAVNHASYMENYSRTKRQNLIGKPRRVSARRKDGSFIQVEISLGEMPMKMKGAQFIAVFREVAGTGDDDDSTKQRSDSTASETYESMMDQRQRVQAILSRHQSSTNQFMESFADEDGDGGSEGDLEESLAELLLDLRQGEDADLVLTESSFREQMSILDNHKRAMNQVTQATKNLDTAVKDLIHEARQTTTTELLGLMDTQFERFDSLSAEVEHSKETTRELERENELLKKCLKTRTCDLLKMQSRMIACNRKKASGPVAPNEPVTPSPPTPPKPSGCPFASAAQAPPATKPEPAASVRPIVIMSYLDDEKIMSLHASVSKIFENPLIQSGVSALSPGLTMPSPAYSVPSTLLGFDIEFLGILNQVLLNLPSTSAPQSQTAEDSQSLLQQQEEEEAPSSKKRSSSKQPPRKNSVAKPRTPTPPENATRPEKPKRKSPVDNTVKKTRSQQCSQNSTQEPGPQTPPDQSASQGRDEDHGFQRSRALANFKVLAHKARLGQIQDAMKSNQSGYDNWAIEQLLKRLMERRLKALSKWELIRKEIVSEISKKSQIFIDRDHTKPETQQPQSARRGSIFSSASQKLPQIFPLKHALVGGPTTAAVQPSGHALVSENNNNGHSHPHHNQQASFWSRRSSMLVVPKAHSLQFTTAESEPRLLTPEEREKNFRRQKTESTLQNPELDSGGHRKFSLPFLGKGPAGSEPSKPVRFVRQRDLAHAVVYEGAGNRPPSS